MRGSGEAPDPPDLYLSFPSSGRGPGIGQGGFMQGFIFGLLLSRWWLLPISVAEAAVVAKAARSAKLKIAFI